jgi:hypothetical protein
LQVGLAYWGSNRWEWKAAADASTFHIDDIARYTKADGRMLAVVMAYSDKDCLLRRVVCGPGDAEIYTRSLQVSADAAPCSYLKLLDLGGKPAIVAVEQVASGSDYRYRVVIYSAKDVNGFSWYPPVSIFEHPNLNVGLDVRAAVIDGMPAVAILPDTLAPQRDLLYARALDAEGQQWPSLMVVPNSTMFDGDLGELAEVDQNAALLWTDLSNPAPAANVVYKISRDADGVEWRDNVVWPGTNNDRAFGLMVAGGNPALGYYTENAIRKIYYRRATDILGSAWGSEVLVDDTSVDTLTPQLIGIVDSRPAVVFSEADASYFKVASQLQGDSWLFGANEIQGDPVSAIRVALIDGELPTAAYIPFWEELWEAQADNSGVFWTFTDNVSANIMTGVLDIAAVGGRKCVVTASPVGNPQSPQPAYIRFFLN